MDWVKRNLWFVVGGAAALLLMGWASWYLWGGLRHNQAAYEKLSGQFAELKRLYDLNPNPGNEKVDNIRAARQQQQELRAWLEQARRWFVPVPAIPPIEGTNRVQDAAFAAQLRQTIAGLERAAAAAGVSLPPKNPQTGAPYYFSFEAQRTLLRFAPGSLEPLAVQLGEVKAICDLLFEAKINALDNLRRERISTNDYTGPYSDYLSSSSVTNDLAIITPYEVTLRCFSPELARLLNAFRTSPHCLLIKTLDVEPAPATTGLELQPGQEAPLYPSAVTPAYPAPSTVLEGPAAAAAAFRRRYGLMAESGRGEGGRVPGPGTPGYPGYPPPGGRTYPTYPSYPSYPTPAAPGYATPGVPAPGAPGARSGMQTVIDEKLLRVTLTIHAVKLRDKETNR